MGKAWFFTAALLSATACIQSSAPPAREPTPMAVVGNGESAPLVSAPPPAPRRWDTIVIGRDPAYEGAVFSTPAEAPPSAATGTTIVIISPPVYAPYGYGYRYAPRPAPRNGGLPRVGGDWPRVPDHGPRMR